MKSGYWLGVLGRTCLWQIISGHQVSEMWKKVWDLDGPKK